MGDDWLSDLVRLAKREATEENEEDDPDYWDRTVTTDEDVRDALGL